MGTPNEAQYPVEERRRKVVQLRLAGVKFDEIGHQLREFYGENATDLGALARVDWQRAREKSRRLTEESVEELRSLQVDRLERLLAAVWPKALRADDPKFTESAARIIERLFKLQGLEPPTQVQLSARIEMESTAVAEAVIAAIDSLGFTPEVRMRALEAAQVRLAEIAAAQETTV